MDVTRVDWLAELIWTASRADEGTISAIGAQHVARAIVEAGWHQGLQAEAWDEGWIAGMLDGRDRDLSALPKPNPYRD